MSESKISQHLDRRDGELGVVSKKHEEDASLLSALGSLKAELNNMPDVAVEPRDWQGEAARLLDGKAPSAQVITPLGDRPGRRWTPRFVQYPMATAALVLFATALFVTGIGTDFTRDDGRLDLASVDLVTDGSDPLPALIARSQDLESIAQISGSWAGSPAPTETDAETALARLILMQVAAIDDRLSSMEGDVDPERMLSLWQRRVNLLEAYNAAIEGPSPDLRRSM